MSSNGIALAEYNSKASFTLGRTNSSKLSSERKTSVKIANSMLSVVIAAFVPVVSQNSTHIAPYLHYNNNTKQNNYSFLYNGELAEASKVKHSHRNVVKKSVSDKVSNPINPTIQEVIGGKYKPSGEIHSFDFEMDFVQNIKYPKFDSHNVLKKSPID